MKECKRLCSGGPSLWTQERAEIPSANASPRFGLQLPGVRQSGSWNVSANIAALQGTHIRWRSISGEAIMRASKQN